jgi:hypothetical protein
MISLGAGDPRNGVIKVRRYMEFVRFLDYRVTTTVSKDAQSVAQELFTYKRDPRESEPAAYPWSTVTD